MALEDIQLPDNDLALVRAARDREPAAVRALAERLTCIPRILAVLNARSGAVLTAHDIEDLCQEVTLLVLAKLGEYRPIRPLEAWVYRICALQMMNARRRASARQVRHARLTGLHAAAPQAVPDPLRSEVVEKSMRALEPECEVAIRLKHFDGLSFTQIGERLDVSPNTIKGRYYRGLDALRRSLPPSLRAEDLE
ncbi:MAG: sigma-70 family RNA polymerase sigma factor [bacterium]|nr:sigma-70 family RNA polymerase sigma factor [bacterium]